jgi:tetratricopeptide (TPR) repeat protein
LANHRALLVLDNLETFRPEERRRLFELLANLPAACRAIVTSRRRTDGSFASHVIRLDKLEREAADELLTELGQRWEPVARLTPAERDQLYAETNGNPLLLTWTAGQLGRTTGRCRTVAEAVERLQEAHRLQSLGEENDPLDFVFGDLLETFTPDETAVLAALVHFTQPARLEWLLPMTELSRKAAETALDGLRDRSLLVEDDMAGTWLLPPLAARFLRRARPEAVGTSGERLANWAYALAVENGNEEYARFPALEAAWPPLAAALPLLLAGDNRRLQSVCDALDVFLDFSGRWDDLLALHTEAETKAVLAKDFSKAGRRVYQAGWCHYLRGQSAEVLACADRAAAHWGTARADARERATAIRLRGIGHQLAKYNPAAIAAYREVLDLHRSLSPKSVDVAIGLSDLADALRLSGQLDEAETHYREALAIATALPDLSGVATYTGNLAELALDREQWAEAERLARQALRLADELGRKELIASDSYRLAKALARQSRGGEGRSHAERAVAIFTELRSPDLAEAQAVLAECQGPSYT